MTQKNIFVTGLVVLCVLLFVLRMWLVNTPEPKSENSVSPDSLSRTPSVEGNTIELPANQGGWRPVGKGPMDIRAAGKIDLGGGRTAVPDDTTRKGDEKAMAPKLPYGMLIGKIGEAGEPFRIGVWNKISMNAVVYLAINDDDHSDNSGYYTVTIKASDPVRAPEDMLKDAP
jgi:hypothetical protein